MRLRPMACIPLGVETSIFRPDSAAGAAALHSLGWSENGPPVIGYVGRFVPEKGLRVLTAALEALRAPWRVFFLGGGKQEGELRTWAAKYTDDRVRVVTGVPHDRVAQYVCAMDILAAPSQTTRSWKEQFGRMLIEAMACGVAVVGSDSGEIPFVIGDAGEVVGETDVPGWTRTLGLLLENPARRAELAARGRERAETVVCLAHRCAKAPRLLRTLARLSFIGLRHVPKAAESSLHRYLICQACAAGFARRRLRALARGFAPRIVRHTYGGHDLEIRLTDPLSAGWYDNDWPVLAELRFLREHRLRPGATVYDLGAASRNCRAHAGSRSHAGRPSCGRRSESA